MIEMVCVHIFLPLSAGSMEHIDDEDTNVFFLGSQNSVCVLCKPFSINARVCTFDFLLPRERLQ